MLRHLSKSAEDGTTSKPVLSFIEGVVSIFVPSDGRHLKGGAYLKS
jgi:hypothetical protein